MNLKEIIIFGIIMVTSGFLTSYITDFVSGNKIIWVPGHAYEMASGTFFSSVLVYVILSKWYVNYKCNTLGK